MSKVPVQIKYTPAQATERNDAIEDFKRAGYSIQEIPDSDGSGNILVIFTPPEDDDVSSPDLSSPPIPPIPSSGNLAWGAKVSDKFRKKVSRISGDLGCDPDFLMAAMAFETRETFSPKIKNPTSGATGLIQFMPNTAIGLGTTTAALALMSAENQLDFVEKYFASQKGKLHTLEDVYMAILWPVAVGKNNNYVLFAAPSMAYKQNKGLDSDGNGQVTKAEAAAKVQAQLDKGRKPGNVG